MADSKYKCRDCGKEFMSWTSTRKDRNGTPICPHCGKDPANIERVA